MVQPENSQYNAERQRVADYVKANVGRELTAWDVASTLGLSRNIVSDWLRARSRNSRSTNQAWRPFDGKVYRVAHGRYVYFPAGVPIDWRDRIHDYADRKRGGASSNGTAPKPALSAPSSMMFEMIRFNPDTNRMLLADENGDVWVGTLTKVEA